MPYVDPDSYNNALTGTRATSGALPQAIARKNARRGGTPNAPEVDDEPAPASNNGSAAPQGIASGFTPQSDAMDQFRAGQKNGGIAGGLGAMTSSVIGSGVAGAVDAVGNLVKPIGDFVGGYTGGTPTAPGIGQAQAAPAPGTVGPPAPPTPAPGQAIAMPNATGTAPASYQAPSPTAVAPTIGSPPGAPGSGSDVNPGGYHQQYLAMQAKEAADLQSRRTANVAQGNAAGLTQDLSRQEGQARVANWRALNAATDVAGGIGPRYGGIIAANLAAGAAGQENAKEAGMRGAATAANLHAETAGNRDMIGEAATQGATMNAGVAATQGAQQNALTNPLHVTQLQQAIASGGTAQKIAELQLQGHQARQDIISRLAKTTDPDEHLQLTNSLLAMEGKPPTSPYKIHGVPGALGEAATGFVIDERTGKANVIAGKENPVTSSMEGQKVRGKAGTPNAGKVGTIVKGQFVPD